MPYRFGAFRVDPAREKLWRGDELVPLNRQAVKLLLALVERHGEPVSKQELLSSVWPKAAATTNNLSQHVFMLRSALGDASNHRYILTVPGVGYQFVAPLERGEADSAQRIVARHACDIAAEFHERRTPAAIERAIDLYREALAHDSRCAQALAGMALCRLLRAEYQFESPREMLELAEQDALQTLELDRGNPVALVVLAQAAAQLRYHWIEAETLLLDSVRSQPDFLWSHVRLIEHYAARGRIAQARQALVHANSLRLQDDPFPRLPMLAGTLEYLDGAFDAASSQLRVLVERHPQYALARLTLAKAQVAGGLVEQGLENARAAARIEVDPLAPGQPDVRRRALALCVQAYAMRGDREGMRAAASDLDAMAAVLPVSSFCSAVIAMAYGRRAQAVRSLQAAIAARERYAWYAAVDPLLDPLRALPAWSSIPRAMNLATS